MPIALWPSLWFLFSLVLDLIPHLDDCPFLEDGGGGEANPRCGGPRSAPRSGLCENGVKENYKIIIVINLKNSTF